MIQSNETQQSTKGTQKIDPYRDPNITYFHSLDEAKKEVKGDNVLIVEGAEWCVYCKNIAPSVKRLAQETGVKVFYVDRTNENLDPNTPLPRLSVYSKGRLIDSKTGAPPEAALREFYFGSIQARHVALARDMLKQGTEVEAAKRVLLNTLEISRTESPATAMALSAIIDYSKAHPQNQEVISALLKALPSKPFGDLSMSLAASLAGLRGESKEAADWFATGSKMQGVDNKWFALSLQRFQRESQSSDRHYLMTLAQDTSLPSEVRTSSYQTLFWNFALRIMSSSEERRDFARLTKSIAEEGGTGKPFETAKYALSSFLEIQKLISEK